MGSSHLVIDGSNIATEGRSLPSLSQLLGAVDAAKADLGADAVTVIVDATFGHRIEDDEKDAYEDKISSGEIITPPAGVIGRGDAFILEVADRADAVVLSNDSFQEFHGEYRWLFDEGRLLGGKHVPGVGWIFLARSPVRGVVSRKAIADSKKKGGASTTKKSRSRAQGAAKKSGRQPATKKSSAKQSAATKSSAKKSSTRRSARSGASGTAAGNEPERYNEALPFIEFVGTHPVGSTVEGEVEQFSSHGAYVMVGETRCYIPLKALGDPAPRSARDVINQGERYQFVVEAIDTPRRGVDLSLVADASAAPSKPARKPTTDKRRPPDPETTPPQPEEHLVTDAEVEDESLSVSQRRKLRAQLEAQDAATATGDEPALEESGAAAKVTASPTKAASTKAPGVGARRRAAAAKASKEKAPAKKAAAEKAPAKKAPAKKVTVRKSTTKTTAKKAPAKKSTARKAPAKKTTAKASAKKASAKKTTARKSTAKKAPAKKTTAKRTPAKKSSTKKAPVKKTTTKKTTTKKTTANKST